MWIKYDKNRQYEMVIHINVPSEAPGLDPGINKTNYKIVNYVSIFKSGIHKGCIKTAITNDNCKYRITKNGVWVYWQPSLYHPKGGEWIGDKRWDCTSYYMRTI